MRCIKMLGLAGLVAVALMAFAGTASATTLTSPAKTPYTSTFELRSGNVEFDFTFGKISCTESEFIGKVEFHGNGLTAGGKISSLTFANCGEGNTFTVLKPGSLEIDATTPAGNGLVKWTNGEVKVHVKGGFTCTIKTSNTPIGTLTGSNETKGNAQLDLNGSKVPVSGAFCGTSAEMTNKYAVITPATLEVDAMI
jgi:hypothetical protein